MTSVSVMFPPYSVRMSADGVMVLEILDNRYESTDLGVSWRLVVQPPAPRPATPAD